MINATIERYERLNDITAASYLRSTHMVLAALRSGNRHIAERLGTLAGLKVSSRCDRLCRIAKQLPPSDRGRILAANRKFEDVLISSTEQRDEILQLTGNRRSHHPPRPTSNDHHH